MAWRRTGDMPLPEPMMTQPPDTYMRHSLHQCMILLLCYEALVTITSWCKPQFDAGWKIWPTLSRPGVLSQVYDLGNRYQHAESKYYIRDPCCCHCNFSMCCRGTFKLFGKYLYNALVFPNDYICNLFCKHPIEAGGFIGWNDVPCLIYTTAKRRSIAYLLVTSWMPRVAQQWWRLLHWIWHNACMCCTTRWVQCWEHDRCFFQSHFWNIYIMNSNDVLSHICMSQKDS